MRKSYICLMVCLCSLSVAAEDYGTASKVQHDPFQKPVLQQISDVGDEASKLAEEKPWTPKLTATLRAGRNSMANVNGKIIKLGETFNGYKLVKVEGMSALFIKKNRQIKLTIDETTNK
jgi:hypothetical protein